MFPAASNDERKAKQQEMYKENRSDSEQSRYWWYYSCFFLNEVKSWQIIPRLSVFFSLSEWDIRGGTQIKRLISTDDCLLPAQRPTVFVTLQALPLLLLPVMETSRGPARLGNSATVFLSLCHPSHDELRQQPPGEGEREGKEGQQNPGKLVYTHLSHIKGPQTDCFQNERAQRRFFPPFKHFFVGPCVECLALRCAVQKTRTLFKATVITELLPRVVLSKWNPVPKKRNKIDTRLVK